MFIIINKIPKIIHNFYVLIISHIFYVHIYLVVTSLARWNQRRDGLQEPKELELRSWL